MQVAQVLLRGHVDVERTLACQQWLHVVVRVPMLEAPLGVCSYTFLQFVSEQQRLVLACQGLFQLRVVAVAELATSCEARHDRTLALPPVTKSGALLHIGAKAASGVPTQ